ncbi:2TM domain-containing protein [Candidatus Lokiarchaeum ossiferum]|uniref:2TM domain-containing protein n=1 Tax=Candidatus Lokiarchaeum ossiferum TaxID=2951803 RepID=UPI00352D5AA1
MTENNYYSKRTQGSSNFVSSFVNALPYHEQQGLKIHWIVYLLVNAFLFLVNIFTGYYYPWHLFPLASWGVGISIHTAVLYVLQRYHSISDRGFYIHFSVFLTLSGFFLFLNIITGFGYPWFMWPVSVLGVAIGEHFVAYKRISNLEKGLPVHPLHAVWYSAVVCIFLLFVDLVTGGYFLWFWIPSIPIMGLTYLIVNGVQKNTYHIRPMIRPVPNYSEPSYVTPTIVKTTDNNQEYIFCPACGVKNRSNHLFCESCGQQLK